MTEHSSTEWREFFNGHAPVYEENCFTKNTVAEVEFLIGRATAEVRAAKDDPDARAKFLAAQCALLTESETKQFAIKQLSGVLRSDGMDPEEASLLQEVQQLLK